MSFPAASGTARITSSLTFGILALGVAARAWAQTPSLEAVLSRATSQLQASMPALVRLVAEEDFTQQTLLAMPSKAVTLKRHLKSDVLLVGYPGSGSTWMLFRDIAEVDGIPQRQDPERLMKLFVSPPPDVTDRVLAIAEEGVRHQLPGSTSALTNPFVAIALMQPHYRDRLRFTMGGRDREVGPNVRILKFEEVKADDGPARDPLFGRGRAKGSVWIDEITGQIHKSETWPTGEDAGRGVTTTTFRLDDRLGVMVPQHMHTSWRVDDRSNNARGVVTGVATYGRFRRFEVDSSSTIAAPGPGR